MIIEKYNKKKNVKYNKKYEKSRERQGEIWSEKVLDIFWPSICPFCGKVNRGGVCPLCRKAVEKLEIHEPRCLKCGKPIRCEEREFCHDCYNTEHIYERGLSVWIHKPPVNQAIYQLKYHNQRYVAKYFAQEICIKYAEEIRRWRPQALVTVPLHRKRRRKRGYNQAELLAEEIGKILCKLKQHGLTIFMISHDVEFVAEYADRVGLFFEGNVVTSQNTREFFAGNNFYTTAANRMARQLFPDAVTGKDVITCLQKSN